MSTGRHLRLLLAGAAAVTVLLAGMVFLAARQLRRAQQALPPTPVAITGTRTTLSSVYANQPGEPTFWRGEVRVRYRDGGSDVERWVALPGGSEDREALDRKLREFTGKSCSAVLPPRSPEVLDLRC